MRLTVPPIVEQQLTGLDHWLKATVPLVLKHLPNAAPEHVAASSPPGQSIVAPQQSRPHRSCKIMTQPGQIDHYVPPTW